jgi:hypothetical protein
MTTQEKQKEVEKQLEEIEERIKRFHALQQQTSQVLASTATTLRQLKDDALEQDGKDEENRKLLGKLSYLRAELDSLKDDDPLIFRNEKFEGRTIIIFDIASDQVQVLEIDANRRQAFSGANRVASLRQWIDRQDITAAHFLLILRPDTNQFFSPLRSHLQSKNASYGFDVIGANRPLKMRSEIAAQAKVL